MLRLTAPSAEFRSDRNIQPIERLFSYSAARGDLSSLLEVLLVLLELALVPKPVFDFMSDLASLSGSSERRDLPSKNAPCSIASDW